VFSKKIKPVANIDHVNAPTAFACTCMATNQRLSLTILYRGSAFCVMTRVASAKRPARVKQTWSTLVTLVAWQ